MTELQFWMKLSKSITDCKKCKFKEICNTYEDKNLECDDILRIIWENITNENKISE